MVSAELKETTPHDTTLSANEAGPHGYQILATLSHRRKISILCAFCFTQCLDIFNNCAIFPAIPDLSAGIGMSTSQAVWVVSGYQITFASLLLVSGRLSDIFDAKTIFLCGSITLGGASLGSGFVNEVIPFVILRAITGVGAALTIPSTLHMLVHLYPDPADQAKAIAMFGAAAGLSNVLGIVIGSVIVTFKSWRWVLYVNAILSFAVSASILLLVPNIARPRLSREEQIQRIKRLDLIGVTAITAALILFIFAVTSGSTIGWKTAEVIAPLVLSAVLFVSFFVWEAKIPQDLAAIPVKMWRYENFTILLAVTLLPFNWFASVFFEFSWIWQDVIHWTPLNAAVHFLPIGLTAFPVVIATGYLQQHYRLKWVISLGLFLLLIGTTLLPFSLSAAHYWRFAFPGMLIGATGTTIVYGTVNIAIFAITPPEIAGMVGGIFNCALQLGGSLNIAIMTSIQVSVEKNHGGPLQPKGHQAGLWFFVAFIGTLAVAALVFMKDTIAPVKQNAAKKLEEEARIGTAADAEPRNSQRNSQLVTLAPSNSLRR